jgi:rhodanese-related sulfurtransferase
MFSFLHRSPTREIDVDELDRLITDGSVHVIDVREDHEWARGHVAGAIHIPVKRLPDRVGKLKRDTRYAVICASGSRSRGATELLVSEGFEDAVSVRGGTSAWARSGRLLAR